MAVVRQKVVPRGFFYPRSPGWVALLFLLMAFKAGPVLAQRPLGIDVFEGQGSSLNWTSIKTSGVSFAWAKATEGLTLNDSDFTINEAHAAAARVFIGAYHFAHPETHYGTAGADEEAAHFWSVAGGYIKGGGVYLMPMLDIETELTNTSPAYTKATLSQWVNEWCQDIVKDATSNGVVVKPVVYTFTSYATTWLNTTVTNWPLWMAEYPDNPNPQTGAPSTTPWSNWAVWQFNDTNTMLNGTPRDCDVDVFNGTAASLGALVIGGLASPYLTSQPVNDLVTDTGGSVSFSATAGGVAPLNYQWTLNGVGIAGATNPAVTITDAQTNDSGNYALVVTNSGGGITSSVVSLLVYPPQATVFADDFDSDTATNWIVNTSSSDNAVAFNFDYSRLGIPSAPHSNGGTTRGVQLKANLTKGVCAALSISPTNQSFSGDYRLHFDAWINVNGPFPGGGASSTEFLTAGIGTSGKRVEWTTNLSADGYYFSADGDGGVSGTSTTFGDYAGYIGANWQNAASGIYTAGSLDNAGAYYTTAFPAGLAAPALQQSGYPQQTGDLSAGTFGFAWHDVIVSRRGSTVNWAVDGILFATISNATLTASNVFVGYWDPFASSTDNTNLSFGLVDNVRVEVSAVAPVITTNPAPQLVPIGANVTLTAAATGLPTPNFQWQFNDAPISGATNASLTLTNVQPANEGNYSVVATNDAGSAASPEAGLALIPPSPAQFQSIVVEPGGSLQISFTGDANTNWTYTIETSTNLVTWSIFTNLSSANGSFNFSVSPVANRPRQFFRAVSGP
jgi:GH25 family lysozyme M1 (1,4-beta-N-acetylmuramidase)